MAVFGNIAGLEEVKQVKKRQVGRCGGSVGVLVSVAPSGGFMCLPLNNVGRICDDDSAGS
jgi:hypothetical protein